MRTALLSVVSGLLAAAFVLAFDRHRAGQPIPPVIEVVDLQQLLTEQVAEVSRQKLSVERQRDAATTFATALSTALDATAQSDHAVLLVKPAVLNGAPDATDAVRLRLHLALATPNPSTSSRSAP